MPTQLELNQTLCRAVCDEDAAEALRLIDAGATEGADEVLSAAGEYGLTEVVRRLLAQGVAADKPHPGCSEIPLHRAATGEIAEMLIARGAAVDHRTKDGETPLMYAASNCRVSIVILELLIRFKADFSPRDCRERDVLAYALTAGNQEEIEIVRRRMPSA